MATVDCDSRTLVNIFRFIVKNEPELVNTDTSADPMPVSSPTANTKNTTCPQTSCLDLTTYLLERRIVEQSDEKPWDKLQQILFERIIIDDISQFKLVQVNTNSNCHDNEFIPNDGQILRYLYGCYYRLCTQQNLDENAKKFLTEVIINQAFLYLTEPDVFPDRDKRFKIKGQPAPMLVNLVSNYHNRVDLHVDLIKNFVSAIGNMSSSNESAFDEQIVRPTYSRLIQKFVQIAIDDPSLPESFNIVRIFLQQPNIAQKLLEKNFARQDSSVLYESTMLGSMIGVTHLPRPTMIQITFFKNIRFGDGDHKFTENQIGIKLQSVAQELHKIFHSLLKVPQMRNLVLSWLGRCLHTFKDRKKLWNNQVLMATTPISYSDGFLLNFMAVMLLLSEPFAGPYNMDSMINNSYKVDKRMLKVDPRYCKWSKSNHQNSSAHFLGLSEETFLVKMSQQNEGNNSTPNDVQAPPVQPNFISECFFGTHQAFTYGFRSIYERFFKLAQTITELQQAYTSALAQAPPPGTAASRDPVEMIKEQAESAMSHFYNLKAGLMAPSRLTMQLHFCIATAAYLNHLVMCRDYEDAINSQVFRTVTPEALKDNKLNRECLEYIPEMLVENVLDFFIFLKNFNEQALSQATGMLEPIMTLIITFMGNSSLMQNPHLRARFAEILECLMPHQSPFPHHVASFTGCTELFEVHPLIEHLAPSLVNVFVSIEMTGEGVQFEQKFSYRRPMYVVLEYLWNKPFHRQILIQLAVDAEKNINSARPPLFLRFINLLMNDAIFLLDEALGYMNQLREAERRKRSEEWQRYSPQQRAQAEVTYSHVGRLARFHNVLSMSTIGTLTWLTNDIKTIFCHPSLVDRIANMLNYFLEHLVGPKKGKFNVTDKNDYEFRPKDILAKICQIYINLGQSETNKKYREFCTAVSSDGRSYSESLLPQATDILFRTGQSALGTEFEKLSTSVHEIAVRNQMDEISSDDIPDTFLDPIMSTVMTDPVLLPSSKIIVDRSTIARHLLSDQTDPFNRSPLSMEDVIPEVDLRKQIETFLRERRQAIRDRENK